MNNIDSIYYDGTYLSRNPDWDRKDSPWKVAQVASILFDNNIKPSTLCELGCGSGDVLINLQKFFPYVKMTGYDISPDASQFWKQHHKATKNIKFHLGHFHEKNKKKYDVILMLDVFEHVRDPFSFLENSRKYAINFIFHIPLDLSAVSIIRKNPLLINRKKVGHLHYYTKDLALTTLTDSGYDIIDWRYTNVSLSSRNRSLKTRLAAIPRKLIYTINKDFGVRFLGGETLLVLAKPLTTIINS